MRYCRKTKFLICSLNHLSSRLNKNSPSKNSSKTLVNLLQEKIQKNLHKTVTEGNSDERLQNAHALDASNSPRYDKLCKHPIQTHKLFLK